MEHPADPGPPYPSIWATSEFGLLADEGDLEVVEFDQCCLGACSRKPTMLASSSPEVATWGQHRCRHFGHPPLIGRGPDGAFRTKDAQAYPSGPCRVLALLHPREFCMRPAREDRIGPSATEFELAAVQEEMALGEHLPIPAIGRNWDPIERWSEVFRWKWQTEEHINVLEARALLAAVRRAMRDRAAWGRRVLVFVDSQVTLCCVSKGRSSRLGLNYVCRRIAALGLACEFTPVIRWVPTRRSHADGPS